ncbi:MAG: L-rhamnose mutarotase [Actinobacteria bacterium]|nr:L-rhamnose mutarotase [Actinomycetota bacterium]
MFRVANIFKIRPEYKDEYKKAHDEIWPELVKEIKALGIKNYSIYFRKDGTLFSYFEVDLSHQEFDKRWEEYFKKDICKKWQDYMSKYIIKKDKTKISPDFEDIEEVFHLD